MPDVTHYFFSSRPAYPWSEYPLGTPALALVGLLLVALTLWTYRGQAVSRGRRLVIVSLRLAALVVALLTAVRPSVGVQEEPKVPSTLLIGVDLTKSMSVKDEFNNQGRAEAVRKTLERCQPTLDELRDQQQVNVVLYRLGPTDFNEATGKYDPATPPDGDRSDYGTYLSRVRERWQGERFLRGHLVIGDGADNGTAFSAVAEAGRWKGLCPVGTFVVGQAGTPSEARDLAAVALSCDPARVPIKNDVTIKAVVNAFGFAGATVKARVFFDDKEVVAEDVTLANEKNNEVSVTTKAPATPGEVKVRFEVPVLPGEVSPLNNSIETYMTVTKEGVRVLVVDRLRWEETRLRDALRSEKRFDVYEVIRQGDEDGRPDEAALLDLDAQGYDVVIIGNVAARQLTRARPDVLQKLAERVTKKGAGLLLMGGERAFGGTPDVPGSGDWRGTPVADILPVDISAGGLAEAEKRRPGFQTVPTRDGLARSLMRVGTDEAESRALWDDVNLRSNRSRLTGYNRFAAKAGTATVYAVASNADQVVDTAKVPDPKGDPLLVGHQIGDGDRGRVLAFAGFDSYLWERLGQPATRQGVELHHRFWRQLVLWLAHQEEDEGQVYARPDFRRLAVGAKQSVKVGVRGADGVEIPNAKFEVRVVAPGEPEEAAKPLPVVADPAGGARLPFVPAAAGEYVVVVKAEAKDAKGADVKGEARARFLAYPDVSDEMLRTGADADFLAKLAAAGGGRALRLEDLPAFLKELKATPLEAVKPKPKYRPDWRRNHSGGFLQGWLVLFATLLGTEWGLRRLWGMA